MEGVQQQGLSKKKNKRGREGGGAQWGKGMVKSRCQEKYLKGFA